MTDKTEAQPEALRLADALAQADRAEAAAINYGEGTTLGIEAYASAKTIRAQHAEIQQLKAQPSARQAAPDALEIPEPDFYVRPSIAAFELPWGVCMHEDSGSQGAYLAETVRAMLSAAPPPPEREPLSKQQVSKIALDLLMTNCTWHALQNAGFFHEIVLFTVEIVAAAERAHGIGATND